MKLSVLGYSGSGKSTLARAAAEKYGLSVLHFDRIQFLPNWQVREFDDRQRLVQEFLDTHEEWVIDGTYKRFFFERRMQESDEIVLLLFNRMACFFRTRRRYRRYKNTTRPDMAEGCPEKYDAEFAKWVLWKGRGKETRALFASLLRKYPEKTVVIRTQRQLDRYFLEKGFSKPDNK